MRSKIAVLIGAFLIAATALPLGSITGVTPTPEVQAGCVLVGNELDCGDEGTSGGWNPVKGGSTGGGSTGPYCTSGDAPWKWPRSSGYPNPVKSASNSIIAEFDERFEEASERVWKGYVNASKNSVSFFWNNSLYDLQAMFMMIDPVTKQLSVASSPAAQLRLFSGTVQSGRTAETTLKTQLIGPPRIGEYTVSLASPGSTVVAVYGSKTAPQVLASGGALPSARTIIAAINSRVGSMQGTGSVDFYPYMSASGTSFTYAPKYVRDAADASWISDGKYGKYPYEVLVNVGGSWKVVSAAQRTTVWPANTEWYVRAIVQNRKLGFTTLAGLRATFDNIIAGQMSKRWVSGGANYYYYPAFLAPSSNTAPGACGEDTVTLKSNGVTFKFPPQRKWVPGSWNNCKTIGLASTSRYNSTIAPDTGACWMAWLKRPLDAPKLPASTWDAAVNDTVYPINFGFKNGATFSTTSTVQIGSTLPSDKDLVMTSPTTSSAYKNFTLGTPIGTTQFNLTLVGFTAEVPGACSSILPPGTGRTVTLSDGSKACELTGVRAPTTMTKGGPPKLTLPTFARTALSRTQDADCVAAFKSGGNSGLLKKCGIRYDGKNWVYRIIIHTWWDGIYKTSGLPYRSLFDPQYVKFPNKTDAAKVRAWDSRFSPYSPRGRSGWPAFGPNYPMYYAVNPPPRPVPYVEILVTQSQSVGG